MNAIAPVASPLVPTDMDQAIRLAKAMSDAKMLPKHLQGDVGTCLMIVEQAMRWQMSPFAVAQCTSNIGGKLMYEGKLIAAAVQSCGAIEGNFDYEFAGEGDDRQVTISARRRGETNPRQMTIKLRDVKTANEFWKKQPDQQLVYSGSRNWARRFTPAALLGVYAPEEFSRDGKPLVDDFDGTTIEAEAPPSTRRDEINKEVPLSSAATKSAPAPTNGGGRHSIAPQPGAPDPEWRACLDKVGPALLRLRTLALVEATAAGPTCGDIMQHGPEWAKAELARMLADNVTRFRTIENAPEHAASDATSDSTTTSPEELAEVRIEGEAKMAAGD